MSNLLGRKLKLSVGEPWDFSDQNGGHYEIRVSLKEEYSYKGVRHYYSDTDKFVVDGVYCIGVIISSRNVNLNIEDLFQNGIASINCLCVPEGSDLEAMFKQRCPLDAVMLFVEQSNFDFPRLRGALKFA